MRYADEQVRRKVGKAGATGGAGAMKKKSAIAPRPRGCQRRSACRGALDGSSRPRLTIYRSARTSTPSSSSRSGSARWAAASTRSKRSRPGDGGNVKAAKQVGTAIAAGPRETDREVVFNRNGFLYHGRVKALADAAREAGLRF